MYIPTLYFNRHSEGIVEATSGLDHDKISNVWHNCAQKMPVELNTQATGA